MELETDASLSKEDTDAVASALTDIAIAAGPLERTVGPEGPTPRAPTCDPVLIYVID
jgi:hypothetical protein